MGRLTAGWAACGAFRGVDHRVLSIWAAVDEVTAICRGRHDSGACFHVRA